MLIALYVHDKFIRPYVGDALVVILLYCLLKSFVKIKPFTAAFIVLTFAILIEIGQYFQLVKILGLSENKLASVVIGTSFSWEDILAYLAGTIFILLFDKEKRVAIHH